MSPASVVALTERTHCACDAEVYCHFAETRKREVNTKWLLFAVDVLRIDVCQFRHDVWAMAVAAMIVFCVHPLVVKGQDLPTDLPTVLPANVKIVHFSSVTLAEERTMLVMLPLDYDTAVRRYPVLYLLHGADADITDWARGTNLSDYAVGLKTPPNLAQVCAAHGAQGVIAMARSGLPEPPTILSGAAITMAPVGGS